jgi:hypothetical protein
MLEAKAGAKITLTFVGRVRKENLRNQTGIGEFS